jgi:hypothetical protein
MHLDRPWSLHGWLLSECFAVGASHWSTDRPCLHVTTWMLVRIQIYALFASSLPPTIGLVLLPIEAGGDGPATAATSAMENSSPVGSSSPTSFGRTTPTLKQQEPRQREFFRDVNIGDAHSAGSINIACYVELPDWWHEMHSIVKSQQLMLIKLTTDLTFAAKEIDVWERLNADQEEARRRNILPLIAATRNATNPFFYGPPKDVKSNSNNNCSAVARKIHRMFREPRLAALILPVAEAKGTAYDSLHTLDEIQDFFKSLLGQLALAHIKGVNNLDLSGNRNVWVDRKDGGAILFDWNGAVAVGEELYDPAVNSAIAPPEAWMKEVHGRKFRMTSVHAWDVWSVGVMFARLIYYPCRWATHRTYPKPKDRLRETILAIIGGNNNNTVVPVDEEFKVDLADVVGSDKTILLQQQKQQNREFQPHLVDRTEKHACSQSSFKYLEDMAQEVEETALDFLKSMMKLSPSDRPDCHTLLKHPFLNQY